jgi:hypothetical protein
MFKDIFFLSYTFVDFFFWLSVLSLSLFLSLPYAIVATMHCSLDKSLAP